jgi:hypothetical protein
MKSFFQRCSLCNAEVMLSEAQNTAVNVVVCRDALACDRRVKQNQSAYLTALQVELKGVEQRRSELIGEIATWYKQTGTPNPVDQRHLAAMALIEQEG